MLFNLVIFWHGNNMAKQNHLVNEYKYAGFRPRSTIKIHPQNPAGRIITLFRRQKKRFAVVAANPITHSAIGNCGLSATCPVAMLGYTLKSRYVVYDARSAEK